MATQHATIVVGGVTVLRFALRARARVCALHATPDDKKRWVLPAVGTGYGTAERFQGHSPTAYLLILNGEMFVIRSEAPYFLYFAAY